MDLARQKYNDAQKLMRRGDVVETVIGAYKHPSGAVITASCLRALKRKRGYVLFMQIGRRTEHTSPIHSRSLVGKWMRDLLTAPEIKRAWWRIHAKAKRVHV